MFQCVRDNDAKRKIGSMRAELDICLSVYTHTIHNIIAHVHQTALIPSTANFYLIFRYCRYFATFYSRLNIFGGFNVGYAYKTAITRMYIWKLIFYSHMALMHYSI